MSLELFLIDKQNKFNESIYFYETKTSQSETYSFFPVQSDSKPIPIDLDLYLLSRKQWFQWVFARYVLLKEWSIPCNLKMFSNKLFFQCLGCDILSLLYMPISLACLLQDLISNKKMKLIKLELIQLIISPLQTLIGGIFLALDLTLLIIGLLIRSLVTLVNVGEYGMNRLANKFS